jgi:hypothetical protein
MANSALSNINIQLECPFGVKGLGVVRD